jgi:hypothetical protein
MRVLRMLSIAAALVLVFAAAAPAADVRVDWKEQARLHGRPVISFRVQRLITRKKGKVTAWAVVASVTNTTTKALRVSSNQFGLALFSDGKTTDPRRAKTLFRAIAFSPALPRVLAPGKSWRGTFIGGGAVANGSYVRVIFGWFAGPAVGGPGFNWISDHAAHWCPTTCPGFSA